MKILGYEIKKQESQVEKRGMVDKLIGDWNVNFFSKKSQSVSERSMNYLPTVWRCIEIISTSIAGLPVATKREMSGAIEKVTHPIDRIIKRQANEYMTAFSWKELMLRDVLTYGNHYSLIDRTGSRPVALYPIPAEDVKIHQKEKELVYEVTSMKNDNLFMASDMLHIKGPSMDGICGMSVIEIHRRSMRFGLSASQYILDWFEGDATPKNILTHPGKLGPDSIKNIRESWAKLYGPGGHKTAVLDAGAKFEQVSLPPSDAMYIEAAQYSDRQICNIYGVPLTMVNDLSDSHYNNIEHTGRQFVTYTLLPWINRVESELNCKLLTEAQKDDYFVDFDPAGLMRGDMQAQSEYYMKMRQSRIMSANEVRKELNLNPYEGGDEYDNPNIDTNENEGRDQE